MVMEGLLISTNLISTKMQISQPANTVGSGHARGRSAHLSISSCCRMCCSSFRLAGITSPRHIQLMVRWQRAPGRLKSQAAQVASSTMADGCSRLVRMMLGYMAPDGRAVHVSTEPRMSPKSLMVSQLG